MISFKIFLMFMLFGIICYILGYTKCIIDVNDKRKERKHEDKVT